MENNIQEKEHSAVNSEPSTVEQQRPQNIQNNSFLIILLSVLLIVSSIIAGFFAWQTQKLVKELRVIKDEPKQSELTPTPTPTSDPIAEWKTYTSTRYHLSFKYPAEINVTEGQNDKTIYLETSKLDSSLSAKEFLPFIVNISLGEMKLEDYITKYLPHIKTTLKQVNLGMVGGKQAESMGPGRGRFIFVSNSIGETFYIFYFLGSEDQQSYQNVIDQILSTFKFLD